MVMVHAQVYPLKLHQMVQVLLERFLSITMVLAAPAPQTIVHFQEMSLMMMVLQLNIVILEIYMRIAPFL